MLRTTRKTAIKCRRAALQQLHNTIVAAPEKVRDQVRNLTRMQRLRTCGAWRPDTVGFRDPVVATRLALKSLARRILDLNDEIAELDRFIVPLVEEFALPLLELEGVGVTNAGELMVAAGENPDRLRSEASFAMMCGACPIPASSGKTQRHRLNRGGNRQANSARHMVVVSRMRTDERTRDYVARRTQEGLSKREVMRCLKRYVGYRVELPEERVSATFDANATLVLTPPLVGPSVTRTEGIIGEGVDLNLKHLDKVREPTLIFHLTKRLLETKWRDRGGEAMSGRSVAAIIFAVLAAFAGVLARVGRANTLARVAVLSTRPV